MVALVLLPCDDSSRPRQSVGRFSRVSRTATAGFDITSMAASLLSEQRVFVASYVTRPRRGAKGLEHCHDVNLAFQVLLPLHEKLASVGYRRKRKRGAEEAGGQRDMSNGDDGVPAPVAEEPLLAPDSKLPAHRLVNWPGAP
jgi:hypothetical protein